MKMLCCCVDSKTMPHQPDVAVKVKEHFLSQDMIHQPHLGTCTTASHLFSV
jgi:hypothetical protein